MTPPAPAARRPSAALLWVLLAAMGAGPLFNYGVSASSTVVMERLDVTSGQLGTVMTVVFAAAAVTSLGLGRAADRLSARAQLSIIFGGTAAALVLGAVAPSLPVLYAAAAVAGVTQAISNPTTNRIIRTVVPPERRIGWVGVKQSGVQAAQLVGGLFFPAASLALGWTGAALGAAVLIGALWVLALVAAPPLPGAPPVLASRTSISLAPYGAMSGPNTAHTRTTAMMINPITVVRLRSSNRQAESVDELPAGSSSIPVPGSGGSGEVSVMTAESWDR